MKNLFVLFAIFASQVALADFKNMQELINKGKYRVRFTCTLEHFKQNQVYGNMVEYPKLEGQQVSLLSSNRWFIDRIAVGNLAKPLWLSRRLNSQTGVNVDDDETYSFSYASIGGSYHGLMSVDKKTGRGHYNLQYVTWTRIMGEGEYALTKLNFKDCKEIPDTSKNR